MHTAAFVNALDQSCCEFFFLSEAQWNILLPHGARCCPNNIHEGRIDAWNLDSHTYGSIVMDTNGIVDLITKLKDIFASVSS